ncbi:MAG: uroporphyrinogen-III synthase [Archangium sp.]|nr:uroporphyrinogen-III synthase [Archangium sp.]
MSDVLLLQPRQRCAALAFLLEDHGVSFDELPLLEVTPAGEGRALRAGLEHVSRFQWLLPDAPEAVRVMAEAAHAAGTWRTLERVGFIAPDHDTARTLGQYEWMPRILLPPVDPREALIDALQSVVHANDEVLVLHAEDRAGPWADALREVGAVVTEASAWRPSAVQALNEAPRAVVVHSAAAAEALLRGPHAAVVRSSVFVATGPTTAHALKHLGSPARVIAPSPADDAVLEATLQALTLLEGGAT